MADLTTVAKVKSYLNINDATSDTLLGVLVSGVSAAMIRYMGRAVLQAVYTETRNGHGGVAMKARQRPVSAVTSVTVNGVAVPAAAAVTDAGYKFDEEGFALNGYSFSRGMMNVVLVYTAGYSSAPNDIDKACFQQVAYEYTKRKRVGDTGKTVGAGMTVNFVIDDWVPEVKRVMDSFKQVAPV